MRTKTLKTANVLLLAALALCLFAACSDDTSNVDTSGVDTSDATLSASSLNGTTWTGSVTLEQSSIPLTLSFDSETNVTISVTLYENFSLPVTCTYEISDGAIIAEGTDNSGSDGLDGTGNSITFNVTSYTGSRLVVTVTSSSGDYFQAIEAGTSITFTKS